MSFLQMSLHGAVMIAVITILRALTLNQVPKKTFLVLWALALVRLLVPLNVGTLAHNVLSAAEPV